MPVLCGIDAHAVDRAADARATLSRQIAEPIDWARVLDTAVEMGTRVFFEIGPGNGLARMARERFPELAARALDDFAGLQGALAWLQRSLAR